MRRGTVEQWPPPVALPETEEEVVAQAAELDRARAVSDAIDDVILAEREQRKSAKPALKVLLLGQAESGKSTILKNLQLCFCPAAFHAEAELWRPVIHLNLLRSVNFILDLLDNRSEAPPPVLSDDVRRLRLGLTPLKGIEETLTKRIAGFVPESTGGDSDNTLVRYHPARASEVSVRSRGWKEKLRIRRSSEAASNTKLVQQDLQARRVISACARDMSALWRNASIQGLLKDEKVSLKDQPGFFLDDVNRICAESYIPTPEDILRARVQTIGPEEHRISMERDGMKDWIVYDVGGSRSQRAAWAQFFDDVTAIIFLAPASGFSQTLAEDPSVNRLADTIQLWRSICGNKLLQDVQLLLFLNKMDILNLQLKSGILFSQFVPSYKDRPNDTSNVSKYLVDAFLKIHEQHTPRKKRRVYAHMTCATDTTATSIVIQQIQQTVMIKALEETHVL